MNSDGPDALSQRFGNSESRGSMIRQRAPLWLWWILLVWVISFPWVGFATRPQWSRVHLVPFADPADRPRDVAANVALFVPFGYSYARRGPWWKAVVVAAFVSVTAEATQLFSTDRFPSATDVTAGLMGTALGAVAARAVGKLEP
jgi:glycopeptide antibiotics resistance protein